MKSFIFRFKNKICLKIIIYEGNLKIEDLFQKDRIINTTVACFGSI